LHTSVRGWLRRSQKHLQATNIPFQRRNAILLLLQFVLQLLLPHITFWYVNAVVCAISCVVEARLSSATRR